MKKIIAFFIILILLSWTVFGTANNTTSTSQQSSSSITTQCSDGIDNDGDGLVDYDGHGDQSKKDPGCFGPADNDESGGAQPPASTGNTTHKASDSGGGTSIPWGLVIGLATPAVFLLAGMAKNNEEAAALGQERLRGVAQNQLMAAAPPEAPQAIQAINLFQEAQGVGIQQVAQGVLVQRVQSQILQAAAQAHPEVGFMLQVYNQVNDAYTQGQILFGPANSNGQGAGHMRVNSDGSINFDNVEFRGNATNSPDVSNYVLGKNARGKMNINVRGFRASKPNDITTLTVSDNNQLLNLNGTQFRGMAQNSVIKLDQNGSVTEADITVGDEHGAIFDLGGKRYNLPRGTRIQYNRERGEAIITNLGGGEATLSLPEDTGRFNDENFARKFRIKGDGRITVGSNFITGNGNNVVLTYAGNEQIKVGKVGESDYALWFDTKSRGIIVNRGLVEKNYLRFNVADDQHRVLLVNENINNNELNDYGGAWVRRGSGDKINALRARGTREQVVEFDVLDSDPYFRPEGKYASTPLRFRTDGDVTFYSSQDAGGNYPRSTPQIKVDTSNRGELVVTNGNIRETRTSVETVTVPGQPVGGPTHAELRTEETGRVIPRTIRVHSHVNLLDERAGRITTCSCGKPRDGVPISIVETSGSRQDNILITKDGVPHFNIRSGNVDNFVESNNHMLAAREQAISQMRTQLDQIRDEMDRVFLSARRENPGVFGVSENDLLLDEPKLTLRVNPVTTQDFSLHLDRIRSEEPVPFVSQPTSVDAYSRIRILGDSLTLRPEHANLLGVGSTSVEPRVLFMTGLSGQNTLGFVTDGQGVPRLDSSSGPDLRILQAGSTEVFGNLILKRNSYYVFNLRPPTTPSANVLLVRDLRL